MEDLFEKTAFASGVLFEVFIDGACSGNPGPAGIGVVITKGKEKKVVSNISKFIGNSTNNIAEYKAFIFALEELLKIKARRVIVKTDSQLLANQLKKKFKVKNLALRELHLKALGLMSYFEDIQIHHIDRSLNKGADKLAVKAIKEQAKMATCQHSLAGGKSGLQREA